MSKITDLDCREFMPIPGYEGRYAINLDGEVLSCSRVVCDCNGVKRTLQATLLKPRKHRRSTMYNLCDAENGIEHRTFTVAYLLTLTFVGPQPEGMIASSKVRWVTRSEMLSVFNEED